MAKRHFAPPRSLPYATSNRRRRTGNRGGVCRRICSTASSCLSTCGAPPCKGGSARNVKTDAVMSYIAKTPRPTYYAVVFTSINADVDHTEHTEIYKRMVEIAESYEGYIGIEPARNPDGSGVAVSTGRILRRSRLSHGIPNTFSRKRRAERFGTPTT